MLEGAEAVEPPPTVWSVVVDERYFDALRLPVIQGRALTALDGTPGHDNVVVNGRFAATYFANQDPIGRRIRVIAEGQKDGPWLTIVGVSPTVRQRQLVAPDAVVYVPQRSAAPPVFAVVVRGSNDADALTSLVREQLRSLDADLPMYRVMPMQHVIDESRFLFRLSGIMISVIAVIALFMSAIGLYAVTAQSVTQRTREIGVRLALGARVPQIRNLMLRRVLSQLVVGLAVGLSVALAWERYFLDPTAPDRQFVQAAVMVPVTGVFAVVVLLGCAWPVRRATRVDPVVALRRN